jgi:hypothetical protein
MQGARNLRGGATPAPHTSARARPLHRLLRVRPGRRPCRLRSGGYDSGKTRDLLEVLGFHGEIAVKGAPAPIQVGRRWPVERTHSWMNGYGKLRRFTDRRKIIVAG